MDNCIASLTLVCFVPDKGLIRDLSANSKWWWQSGLISHKDSQLWMAHYAIRKKVNRRISFQKLVFLFFSFICSLYYVKASAVALGKPFTSLGNHSYIKTEKAHIMQLNCWHPFSFAATCNANNKTYNLGETIVYHTVTDPVDDAMCKMCQCSARGITGCAHYFCDLGLGVRPSLCDNWITKEGECCPICGKK